MATTNKTTTGSRKKKDKSNATSQQSSKSLQQLELAAAKLHATKVRMNDLHKQWHDYLTKISYFIVLLSLHQLQTNSANCIKDIKQYNKEDSGGDSTIPGRTAIALVLWDSVALLLGVFMSIFIALFLRLGPYTSMSHPYFNLAQSLVLPIIGALYYNSQQDDDNKNNSCIAQLVSSTTSDDGSIQQQQRAGSSNKWPIVLVFHVIVALCLWFMKQQKQQMDQNEHVIEDLQNEIRDAKNGTKTTTTTNDKNNTKKRR